MTSIFIGKDTDGKTQELLLHRANRHGLITGATTGDDEDNPETVAVPIPAPPGGDPYAGWGTLITSGIPGFVLTWAIDGISDILEPILVSDGGGHPAPCSSSSSTISPLEIATDTAAQQVAVLINQADAAAMAAGNSIEHGALLVLDSATNTIRSLPIVSGDGQHVPVINEAGFSSSLESTLTDAGFSWSDVVGVVHSHPENVINNPPVNDPAWDQFVADDILTNSMPSDNDAGFLGWLLDPNGGGVTAPGFADRFSNYIIGPDNVLREYGGNEFTHPGNITDANRAQVVQAVNDATNEASGQSCNV